MSSSQLLSMDFDQNKSFLEPSFESFSYMDPALEFLQYPPPSPPALGVSTGLPAHGSPMDYPVALPDYYAPSFGAPSPPRSYSPPDMTASPPSLPYALSGAEMSTDSLHSGRASRGSRSPPAVPYAATVPRSHRFNPMAVPANRPARAAAHKRKASRSNDDSDDDDEDFTPGSSNNTNSDVANRDSDSRRETVRKQRIESEQRRRDELREGYARLKETLPASNQKASKVSLLDRATSHIKYLEAVKDQLEARLKGADHEVHRLRNVNEALMLNRVNPTQGNNGSPGSVIAVPPAFTH